MSFSYANPTSGPSAGGIGWFNFGNLTIHPGDSLTGLTGTLNDGSIVTFDLRLAFTSGQPRTFVATTAPVGGSFFGNAGYTGIPGNVVLYSNFNLAGPGVNTFTISNISVRDPLGNPVPNYTVILADSETSNTGESWVWQTNGGVWQLLATLGNNPPVLTGIGTQTVTISGTQLFPQATQAANVTTTQTPTQLIITSGETTSGRQGFSIGFATTRVRLFKNIGVRMDPADQFVLDITGSPADQAVTAGALSGIQAQFAEVYAVPGGTYTLNESMAPGSGSALVDYTLTVSAANATPAGTVPPLGPLPISFTPALGDDVSYTLLNAAPEVFRKTVDKAFADVGEVLTYTVTVENPNDFAVSNVLVTDATPAGTAYLGGLTVSAPYTGTDPASGITITAIGPGETVTLSWQVQVNTFPPIPNPVPNYANVTVPGGTSGMSNVVTTQVNLAYVTVNKQVDKAFAKPGETLTYTLLLHNAGNVSAENVTIADAIPVGTALVPGSLTGAVGAFPNLSLTSPIPAGGSATVTFQVKVAGIPAVNPIPNFASAAYDYTVDPAQPKGKTGTVRSNTVTTQVSIATLTAAKNVDKGTSYLGDTITYQLAVQNTGNVPADGVVLTDVLPNGVTLVPGSLVVSVPYSGTLDTGLALTDPVAPGQTVTLSFQGTVTAMPNPNPVVNQATVHYAYTLDPARPDGETGTVTTNPVSTLVFRYNFRQQISDLIASVALEQAALAAVANAEGAKIQAAAAMGGITQEELLCLNKSVSEMLESITLLERVLRQKLGIVDCQISDTGMSC